ncbi:hypothetical protein JTB14_006507 [Gonioctena quinquepunctata]|nr:hypothetical protein JTB14_006507 [Gonioctena quinquepunctata]
MLQTTMAIDKKQIYQRNKNYKKPPVWFYCLPLTEGNILLNNTPGFSKELWQETLVRDDGSVKMDSSTSEIEIPDEENEYREQEEQSFEVEKKKFSGNL